MGQHPFTLRVIPEVFRSVLLDTDEDGVPAPAVLWDLSSDPRPPHPWAFTPQLDIWTDMTRPARTSPRRALHVDPSAPVVAHSADRLARAIVLATHSPNDPRTLTSWGQQVGVSRGALRVWCKAAGVSARACLDFLRVLRAVVLASHQAWDLRSMLDVVDQRSLLNLLDRGGVRELCRDTPPTVDVFMARQQFIVDHQLREAVIRHLQAARI